MTDLERILALALVDRDFLEQLKKEDYDPGTKYILGVFV
jgi:hypothetical protein